MKCRQLYTNCLYLQTIFIRHFCIIIHIYMKTESEQKDKPNLKVSMCTSILQPTTVSRKRLVAIIELASSELKL